MLLLKMHNSVIFFEYASLILIMIPISLLKVKFCYTANGERFPGLNFHVFYSFQECRESVSMNKSTSL